eukprot:scpid60777/ scgid4446/ PH domain leucine-rich repeat-containing protein phosphatase 1; Pleckstrin homology domain-containing family E member 1; Suprachiasmatic nucleus circadian oscillatory protein
MEPRKAWTPNSRSATLPLRLSASSPSLNLFPGSALRTPTTPSSAGAMSVSSITSPTTPISETKELDTESLQGVSVRHYSESRTPRRGNSRVLSTVSLRRSNSTGSRLSVDEDDSSTADTTKYGACSFGEQLRPMEVCIPKQQDLASPMSPRHDTLPKSEGVGRAPRRQISLARIVDVSESTRSRTESEELWGVKVRHYVEHFESTTFMTVQVQDLLEGGAAEKQGIQKNDQVLSINGNLVKGMSSEEVVREMSSSEHESLCLIILPHKQTKISNVQIFSPSRASLDILWCVRNQLTTLTLWDIDLSSRARKVTTVDLSRLMLISNLAVCNCRLESLEVIGGLRRLQFLSHARFTNNRLTAGALGNNCPLASIPSIKALILNRNHIKDFPVCVYKLPLLEHVSLAYNQLREVPRTLSALENLKQLNLDGNALVEMDTTLLGDRMLKFLSISRNRIDFNPALEKQGLAAFALFGNPFTSQPYHSSPHARRETRESLRHGSTATWRRRHHRPAKNSPAAVSPLLRARNAGITESRVTIF